MKESLLSKVEALDKIKRKRLLYILFASACIIRIIIAVTTEGYKNDIALFYYWAHTLVQHGIPQFYSLDIFADYPPGYMYVLYAIGLLFQLFHVETGSVPYLLIIKLPIIIGDLLFSYLIYKLASKHLSFTSSVGLVALFLFNPWTIVNGAVWGQVDIIFSLVIVMSFLYLNKEKTVIAAILYGIAALIKPQAFIFIPIILVYLFYKKSIKTSVTGIIVGLSTFLLLAIPFFYASGGLTQLIQLYKETLSSYPYASLNTYNLYSLLGYNWINISESMFTIPIQLLSNIAIVLTVLLVFYFHIRLVKTNSTYFYLAALTISSVYLFVAKMHERYLFPLLLFLLIAYIYEKNKHYLYIVIGYSVTLTINLIAVLNIQQSTYTVPYNFVLVSCSLINIILYIYLIFIGTKNFKHEKTIMTLSKASNPISEVNRPVHNTDKQKINKLTVIAVLLIYTVVTLYQLGNKTAPESSWMPVESHEYVILDLGQLSQVDRIVVFSGPEHTGHYSIYSYEDDTWNEQVTVNIEHTYALSNQVWHVNINTQYVLLQAKHLDISIHEIAFYNYSNQEIPLSVSINQSNSEVTPLSAPKHLIDEQELMKYSPSYLDGSYFDEIYHARTAYEYKIGTSIYETTHPPLGKLLILIGMNIFGFSPFGWRIIGALVGVLVLYIIYKFAKLLFERHSYALTAMILFAVDFMHFTQSRIATIDIYIVLFTMLMFYFMAVYSKTNIFKVTYWKSLIPLALSGICFGFTIATKWNGFYGGVGLAVMLLIIVIKQYSDSKKLSAVYEQINVNNKTNENSGKSKIVSHRFLTNALKPNQYWRGLTTTLLSCCLFFVAVPALIYYLVFFVGAKLSGSLTTIAEFINVQKSMYSYHSSLVATHPFSSPWYEWQLIARPIWYYINNNLNNPELTSTIAAFGNPLIWWFSIVTMLFTIVWSIYKKHFIIIVVYIGFLSQLLPWVFVDRITFIYHFFSMVPFIILSIVYFFQQCENEFKWVSKLRWLFVFIATCLFALFYPVISGSLVSRHFVDEYLRWFNGWYF